MDLVNQVVSWFLIFYGTTFPILVITVLVGITGFIEITRYERGRSFLYRLNPLSKLAFGVTAMVLAATTVWWIGAALTLSLLLLMLTLNAGRRKFVYSLYLAVSLILVTLWGNAPFVPPSVLAIAFPGEALRPIWVWPTYFQIMGYQPALTLQALLYGLQISFRVTTVVLSALLLVLTTTVSDIFRMFTKLKVPLPLLFSLTVGVRSVPRIFEVLDTSVKMQFARGLGSRAPRFISPFYMLVAVINGIVPTMIYMFRGAKNLAISADTRAFRAKETRSSIKELTFSSADYLFLSFTGVMIVLAVLANLLGFGRSIPYLAIPNSSFILNMVV
jgi:energy-coupling factor transport system permease protein